MTKREIPPDEANRKYGIVTLHEEFESELRFRLRSNDGTAYIRTAAKSAGSWQNSHFHKSVWETYIVQDGWMALAELIEGSLRVNILKVGQIVTTKIGIHHNVYMAAGAVTHTVKHGREGKTSDWHASPECDRLTLHLAESEILHLAARPGTL